MTYCFDATHIFTQDDGYMVVIGFADDKSEPGKFVILQKAHEYDDQDKQMGMDKVYIQVEDESKSKYGGINSISVSGGKITISLTDESKSILAVDGDIEIDSDTDHPAFAEVVSQLKTISVADGIVFQG